MALPGSLVELVLAQSRALTRQRTRTVLGRRWTTHDAATTRQMQPFNWSVFSVEPVEEDVSEKSQLMKRLARNNEQTSLDEKLDQLKNIALQHDPDVTDTAEFTDAELQSIYKDILSVPDNITAVEPEQGIEEKTTDQVIPKEELIPELYERLVEPSFSEPSTSSIIGSSDLALKEAIPAILKAIKEHITSMEETRQSLNGPKKGLLPVIVLTPQEWKDLVHACIDLRSFASLDETLYLLGRYHGVKTPIFLELLDVVLSHYAPLGYTTNFRNLIDTCCGDSLTEQQRNWVIKAHLASGEVGPALLYLHELENKGTPAGMKGYHMVMLRLAFPRPGDNHSPDLIERDPPEASTTSAATTPKGARNAKRTAHTRLFARAWDLFTHMRFAAHPTPDRALYTLAIQMCVYHPLGKIEPEKAMDLWYEMVHQSKIAPDADAYDALILTLARASTLDKRWAHEAWRVAREMLDSSRDAEGKLYAHLRPTAATFEHLLELCKRTGDLARCRWIMSEMVKEGASTDRSLLNIFHCYSAFRPPLRREQIALVRETHQQSSQQQSQDSESTKTPEEIDSLVQNNDYHRVPQTAQEVLSEATTIFESIVYKPAEGSDVPPKKFGDIIVKPDLVSAYLAVHASHSTLSAFPGAWLETWRRVKEDWGISPSSRAYMLGMEWCANMPPADNPVKRMRALRMAKVLMKEWVMYERGHYGVNGVNGPGAARRIERVWAAYIRVLALNDRTDEGVAAVFQFYKRYPPEDLRTPAPLEAYDSTRIVLLSNKPLVRITPPHEVGDDTVPPMLTFRDVETLHQRLVVKEDTKNIRSLTFVLESYQGSLRMGRKRGLTATAPSHPRVSVGTITPFKGKRRLPLR